MRHLFYKRASADEGIMGSSSEPQDVMQDSTTPQSRSDLISQAFVTNVALADPTSEASPPAVNPSLSGTPMPGDELSAAARTTDSMGDGMGEHDVLAAYNAGRSDAMAKYAKVSGSHLPSLAATSTTPKGPIQPPASTPQTPSPSKDIQTATTSRDVGMAQAHSKDFGTDIRTPDAPAPLNNSASLFKPTSGPAAQGQMKGASLEYDKKEPLRYTIPGDNGTQHSPTTNQGQHNPSRNVSVAFNGLAGQRNADSLNEAGQAAIGSIG